MIPLTTRKVGKVNPAEVRGFQRRNPGLVVDGKFGAQCFGQLLILEKYFDEARLELARLKAKKPECSPWGFVSGLIVAGVAWLMTQVHVVGSFFGGFW